MSKNKIDKEAIIKAANKLVADKKAMLAYSDDKISKKELSERGVRLAMPL